MKRMVLRRVLQSAGASSMLVLSALISVALAGAVLTIGSLINVSGRVSPFPLGCNGAPQTGTNYPNAEVEPWIDVDSSNPKNLIGVWQQDRWSNGGSNGLRTAFSADGGQRWTIATPPTFARCEGGTAANGGDYERASDPWVSIAPNGDAYQVAITFNNSNAKSAVLVSKSTDHGQTWTSPTTLKLDNDPTVLNDKESVTADPGNAQLAYVVWDRLVFPTAQASASAAEHAIGFHGPAWFTRTTDAGATWETARIIFDPGEVNQTIGNQILVLPDGTLVDGFCLIFNFQNVGGQRGFNVALLRSSDKGLTWSQPIIASKIAFITVTDPNTGQRIRTGDFLPEFAVDHTSGTLYAVWQDARFSGGTRADIAFSQSTDGGLTWSAPVQINKRTSTELSTASAFTPSVRVGPDGRIAVTYYDFRFLSASNTTTLPTDYWIVNCLANCTNPGNWTEQHLAGSFDMLTAANAEGFFVGDYEGLASPPQAVSNMTIFQPFFAMSNGLAVSTSGPSDIFTIMTETTVAP
jgi:hypothetical protein